MSFELIDLARKGSRDAAEVLFDRYWTHAWRAAYAITGVRTFAKSAHPPPRSAMIAGSSRSGCCDSSLTQAASTTAGLGFASLRLTGKGPQTR